MIFLKIISDDHLMSFPRPPLFLNIRPTRAYGLVCLLTTISLMSRPYNRGQYMFVGDIIKVFAGDHIVILFFSLDELNWIGVRPVKEVKAYS